MKIRINYHKNKNKECCNKCATLIYLKVHIKAHHITRTFAKIYDNGLQVILPKRLPSITYAFDIMSFFVYAEQKL